MANSSSGNSSGSTQIHHSGSDDGAMDHRKRKRMESNRESARRSRMRKQKHVDDLMTQASKLKNNNAQILTTIEVTTQRFVQIEAENSVLRAQVNELSQRLDSLNEIMNYINTNTNCTTSTTTNNQCTTGMNGSFEFDFADNPWNMMYANHQPTIMASDMVGY